MELGRRRVAEPRQRRAFGDGLQRGAEGRGPLTFMPGRPFTTRDALTGVRQISLKGQSNARWRSVDR